MSPLPKLNIFSLQYFLYNLGLPAIFSYTALFATYYTNASLTQVGLLRMFLPFFGMASKLIICPIADRRRAHRSVFIWVLIAWMATNSGMVLLALYVIGTPPQEELRVGPWAAFCCLSITADISYNLTTVFADSLAVSSSSKRQKSYGSIRIWAAIGGILGALITSFANDSINLPLLLPGMVIMNFLLMVDILCMTFWPYHQDFNMEEPTASAGMAEVLKNSLSRNSSYAKLDPNSGELNPLLKTINPNLIKLTLKTQWKLLKGVARQERTIYLNCVLFITMGLIQSLQYSFFSVYINETYPSMIFFVTGLSNFSQSLLGDIPMYICSRQVVKYLGHHNALTIAFLGIGTKFLLYLYIVPHYSVYYIIPIEILNGPSSALFFVTMIELGSHYSDCDEPIMALIKEGSITDDIEYIQKLRKALKVTTQSLLSTCHSALGVGLGTVIGGIIHDNLGFGALWLYSGCFAITVGILNFLVQFIIKR